MNPTMHHIACTLSIVVDTQELREYPLLMTRRRDEAIEEYTKRLLAVAARPGDWIVLRASTVIREPVTAQADRYYRIVEWTEPVQESSVARVPASFTPRARQ